MIHKLKISPGKFFQPFHIKNRGFTLLELVISMAIVSIVLGTLFSLNTFGIRSFVMQDSQSSLQTDTRWASDYITREIRTAYEVEILSANPVVFDPDSSYIYTATSGSVTSVMLRDDGETRTITSYSTATLQFITTSSSKLLGYTIFGILKDQSYTMTSSVLALNLPANGYITPENGTGVALRYKKVVPAELGALAITSSLPHAYAGDPYTYMGGPVLLTAAGGTEPYSYYLETGSLPDGLSLDVNGLVTGTPTATGLYVFTIRAADNSSPSKYGYRTYSVIIGDGSRDAASILAGIGVVPDPPPDPQPDPPVPVLPMPEFPIEQPLIGQTALVLPILPPGFMVVIHQVSSSPTVMGLDGSIYPHSNPDPVEVSLWLKVINLIDPLDTATSGSPLSNPPIRIPPGAGNAPPVATDVAILGQTTVGVTLTGLYVYSDAEGDAEGQSTYRWITSLGGTVGTSQSYTLTVADVDNVISFEVTPVALTGTSPGQPVVSTSIGPISMNHKPEAQNVAISLVRISGKWTLVGTFTYYDVEGDPQGIHQYQWYKMDNNGNILPIAGATSTQREVHPTSSNRGKYYFSVTPVALTGTSPGDNVRTDHYEVN